MILAKHLSERATEDVAGRASKRGRGCCAAEPSVLRSSPGPCCRGCLDHEVDMLALVQESVLKI